MGLQKILDVSLGTAVQIGPCGDIDTLVNNYAPLTVTGQSIPAKRVQVVGRKLGTLP